MPRLPRARKPSRRLSNSLWLACDSPVCSVIALLRQNPTCNISIVSSITATATCVVALNHPQSVSDHVITTRKAPGRASWTGCSAGRASKDPAAPRSTPGTRPGRGLHPEDSAPASAFRLVSTCRSSSAPRPRNGSQDGSGHAPDVDLAASRRAIALVTRPLRRVRFPFSALCLVSLASLASRVVRSSPLSSDSTRRLLPRGPCLGGGPPLASSASPTAWPLRHPWLWPRSATSTSLLTSPRGAGASSASSRSVHDRHHAAASRVRWIRVGPWRLDARASPRLEHQAHRRRSCARPVPRPHVRRTAGPPHPHSARAGRRSSTAAAPAESPRDSSRTRNSTQTLAGRRISANRREGGLRVSLTRVSSAWASGRPSAGRRPAGWVLRRTGHDRRHLVSELLGVGGIGHEPGVARQCRRAVERRRIPLSSCKRVHRPRSPRR